MKKILIMLAVATIPAAAGGCNCCGLGTGLASCPCSPCNWFNRGAYCGTAPAYCPPTPTYTPVVGQCPTPCGPAVSAVIPQYPVLGAAPVAGAPYGAAPYGAAPYAATGMVGAPMIADPSAMGYAMPAQPMYYSEPSCGYAAEPGCGYSGTVSYGPSFPVDMGGCCGDGGYGDGGSYDGAVMTAPTEQFVTPEPAAE